MTRNTTKSKYVLEGEDRSEHAVKNAHKNFLALTKTTISLTSAIVGLGGSGGFGYLVKGSLDAGDKIQKLSIRIGASTEALSEYQHVAELTGVTFDSLSIAWQRQTRRISEASQGTGEAVKALDELGLSASYLNTLAPEQQFEVLADSLNGVANQSDKVRLAMKFWDSEGVSLLQTIDGGSESLRQMRAEAQRLGLTLSREQVDKMAEAKDSVSRMRFSLQGMANDIAVNVGPSIQSLASYAGTEIPKAFHVSKVGMQGFRVLLNDIGIEIHELIAKRDELDAKLLPKQDSISGRLLNAVGLEATEEQAIKSRGEHLNAANELKLKNLEIHKSINESQQKYNELVSAEFEIREGKGLNFGNAGAGQIEAAQSAEQQDPIIPEFNESILQDSFTKRIEYLQSHQIMVREIIANHHRLVAQDEKRAMQSRLSSTASILGSLSEIVSGSSKSQFEESKKFARAETYVSMLVSAQKAYESASRFGPVAGALAAGQALLAGGARLKQINSSSYNSNQSAASGGGSSGSYETVPGTGFPVDPNRSSNTSQSENHIHVSIDGKELMDIVIPGIIEANQNDQFVASTGDGKQRVILAHG